MRIESQWVPPRCPSSPSSGQESRSTVGVILVGSSELSSRTAPTVLLQRDRLSIAYLPYIPYTLALWLKAVYRLYHAQKMFFNFYNTVFGMKKSQTVEVQRFWPEGILISSLSVVVHFYQKQPHFSQGKFPISSLRPIKYRKLRNPNQKYSTAPLLHDNQSRYFTKSLPN